MADNCEDCLLIDAASGMRFALATSVIRGIVEMERLPALPGMAGFVSGIISLRGEPVTVVDFALAFGLKSSHDLRGSGHRVVVISDGEKLLGLDIGSLGVSFLWGEDAAKLSPGAEGGRYVKGTLGAETPIGIIDWAPLFNDTVKLLSEGV